MALVSRSTVRLPVALGSAALPMRPVRVVLVRAEPGAKVTREFREDTGEVSTPAASSTTRQQADGLYVNDDGPRPVPRKSNLSKEMKAKLRAEYTGLGGAENKAMNNNYFLVISGIVAVLAICSKLIGAI